MPTWRLAGIARPWMIRSPPAERTRTMKKAGSARAVAAMPALPSTVAPSGKAGNVGAPEALVGVSA